MAKQEITNDEILQALNQFANQVDKRFDDVDKRFDKVESNVAELKSDVNRIYNIPDKHMARIEEIL